MKHASSFLVRCAVKGFTLIELLVVMTIIALLLSIATPRYLGNIDKSKEAVLHENLATIRDVLDKHYADTGKYPMTLEELIPKHYLRRIPFDPITDSDRTWVIIPPDNPDKGAVFSVRSGAPGKSHDGTLYRDW
jgi:general secretion pathway protein G